MLLKGRKAVITGAAGRIGSAIARRFAEEGCSMMLLDLNRQGLEALAQHLKEYGDSIAFMPLDVSNEAEVKLAFAGMDRMDILVNNAGYTRLDSIELGSLERWNEVMSLNLTSVFLCCKYAMPLLRHSKTPAIVNMSSVNAFRVNPGLPAYSAAKSGIIALTQQLAIEGAANRIRANCISPGGTISASDQNERAEEPDFAIEVDCYPLGRLGYPEDVANAALFLSSDLSSFVNGINLIVDGGMSLQAPSALVRADLRQRWKQGKYMLESRCDHDH
ncbi:SDR family NAD(P)-dependent oxidoreductase [Paenibacillus chungangensis]|uniref:SDR family NAD(P)-dependent oxidoreductase n=1 Tax=Paenibacillus chungangensis TaxID=696535 RepID=A0ABW3HYB6_9BACL